MTRNSRLQLPLKFKHDYAATLFKKTFGTTRFIRAFKQFTGVTPRDRLLALNDALDQFTAHAPDKAELLKLRWFGGLSLDQAAAIVGISRSTADRWWLYAREWLKVEIEKQDNST